MDLPQPSKLSSEKLSGPQKVALAVKKVKHAQARKIVNDSIDRSFGSLRRKRKLTSLSQSFVMKQATSLKRQNREIIDEIVKLRKYTTKIESINLNFTEQQGDLVAKMIHLQEKINRLNAENSSLKQIVQKYQQKYDLKDDNGAVNQKTIQPERITTNHNVDLSEVESSDCYSIMFDKCQSSVISQRGEICPEETLPSFVYISMRQDKIAESDANQNDDDLRFELDNLSPLPIASNVSGSLSTTPVGVGDSFAAICPAGSHEASSDGDYHNLSLRLPESAASSFMSNESAEIEENSEPNLAESTSKTTIEDDFPESTSKTAGETSVSRHRDTRNSASKNASEDSSSKHEQTHRVKSTSNAKTVANMSFEDSSCEPTSKKSFTSKSRTKQKEPVLDVSGLETILSESENTTSDSPVAMTTENSTNTEYPDVVTGSLRSKKKSIKTTTEDRTTKKSSTKNQVKGQIIPDISITTISIETESDCSKSEDDDRLASVVSITTESDFCKSDDVIIKPQVKRRSRLTKKRGHSPVASVETESDVNKCDDTRLPESKSRKSNTKKKRGRASVNAMETKSDVTNSGCTPAVSITTETDINKSNDASKRPLKSKNSIMTKKREQALVVSVATDRGVTKRQKNSTVTKKSRRTNSKVCDRNSFDFFSVSTDSFILDETKRVRLPQSQGLSVAHVVDSRQSDGENRPPSRPSRQRRVVSYIEPSLSSKLRRGDQHTDGSMYVTLSPRKKMLKNTR